MGEYGILNIFAPSDKLIGNIENNEKALKIFNVIRTVLIFAGLLFVFIKSIDYVNSGTYYDQAVNFRPICIVMGMVILLMINPKSWLNIITPIWAVISFIFMRYAYIYHWVKDNCDYKYPEIIRMGKIVAFIWGLAVIAIFIEAIRNKDSERLKKKNHPMLLWGLWLAFLLLAVIFMRDYFYVVYIVILFNILGFLFLDPKAREYFINKFELAGTASFLYVMYMSLVHRPFDKQRYMSYFTNENTAGFYFGIIAVLIYMRLYRWWKKDKESNKFRTPILIIYNILFGIEMGFALLNYARTTLVGLIFSFAVMFVIHLVTENKKEVAKRAGIALLMVILLFYPTFLMIRYIPAYINKPVFIAWEYDPEERVIEGDPVDSDKYTSITRYLRIVFGKWGLMINFEDAIYDEDETPSDGMVEIDKDRDVTNGRVEIWTAFISRLNLTGHFPNHIYLTEGDPETLIYHGHNTYLNIMYQYGVPAGIIYGLLNGFTYLYGAYLLVKKKEDGNSLVFGVLMLGMVMMAQLTETMVHPAYTITMAIYLSIVTIMSVENKKNE